MHARLDVARRELPRAVRIAVAATLAWWIARLLGADRPVFAVIVPMVAIRDDAHAALSLSLGRMLGVIAGVLLGIAVVAVAGVSTSAIVLLLVIGLAVGLFLRTGPELNTQIAISALLVLVVTKNADNYAVERIWETGVGSVVSLAVAAFVLPPDPLRDAARRLAETTAALADDLTAAVGTLARAASHRRASCSTRADEHARAAGRAVEDLPRAQRALRLSPLRRGSASAPRCRRPPPAARAAARDPGAQARPRPRELRAPRRPAREWDEAARRLPPIVELVTAGAAKALAGEGCSREVAGANELMTAYQRDGRPTGRGDPAAPARAAARRARPGRPREHRHPADEAAELAALRLLAPPARRLRRRAVALALDAAVRTARLAGPRAPPTCCCASRPVPVLGVTGSAGKTTTARLAEAMLRASGVETLASSDAPADNAWPTADLLERVLAARPPAWCVAELTSNHLAVCSASPQIACITNVWADHVDQHGSLAAYLEAKRRIVAFQAAEDWTVVNADDPGAVELAAASPARDAALHAARPRRATRARASSPGG